MINQPKILLETTRNGIQDMAYYGSYYLAFKNKIVKYGGYNKNTICYLRSLAKPLQASIICDYDTNFNDKEIAIFCASHSGSPKHIELLKKTIKKYGVKISDFELEAQEPLDKRKINNHKTKLHNNCSGKHLMMILMSKFLEYNIKNYTNENHPIQKLIYKKQEELTKYKSKYLTYDGCSTPLWGLAVSNIIEGFYNFFNDEKYAKIINSIIKNPYIFGGYDRLDTEIIELSKGKLFSKVGAGGFVLVYNFKEKQTLLLKMTQNNNAARKLILLNMLNELNWLETEPIEYELNQKNQKVAKYCYKIKF